MKHLNNYKLLYYNFFICFKIFFDFGNYERKTAVGHSFGNNSLGKALPKFLQVDYSDGRKYTGKYGNYEREKDALLKGKILSADQIETLKKENAERCGL